MSTHLTVPHLIIRIAFGQEQKAGGLSLGATMNQKQSQYTCTNSARWMVQLLEPALLTQYPAAS